MAVFIVTEIKSGNSNIMGVFATREEAENYIEKTLKTKYSNSEYIIEFWEMSGKKIYAIKY